MIEPPSQDHEISAMHGETCQPPEDDRLPDDSFVIWPGDDPELDEQIVAIWADITEDSPYYYYDY